MFVCLPKKCGQKNTHAHRKKRTATFHLSTHLYVHRRPSWPDFCCGDFASLSTFLPVKFCFVLFSFFCCFFSASCLSRSTSVDVLRSLHFQLASFTARRIGTSSPRSSSCTRPQTAQNAGNCGGNSNSSNGGGGGRTRSHKRSSYFALSLSVFLSD